MIPAGSELLGPLIATVPTPVVIADLRGRVLFVNGATERALGFRGTEPELHVSALYHCVEEARAVLARLRSRGDVDPGTDPFEVTLVRQDGDLVPVRLTASLLRDVAGQAVASVGVFEARERTDSAAPARVQSGPPPRGPTPASDGGVGPLVHELAQPLTAAMGNVEMVLLDPQLSAGARTRLGRTYEQLERLRGLLVAASRRAPGAVPS